MADDPNELVWIKKDNEYDAVPAYAVDIRKESGWKPVSKADAKKAGYVLPADLETKSATTATTEG